MAYFKAKSGVPLDVPASNEANLGLSAGEDVGGVSMGSEEGAAMEA